MHFQPRAFAACFGRKRCALRWMLVPRSSLQWLAHRHGARGLAECVESPCATMPALITSHPRCEPCLIWLSTSFCTAACATGNLAYLFHYNMQLFSGNVKCQTGPFSTPQPTLPSVQCANMAAATHLTVSFDHSYMPTQSTSSEFI